jgi:hypothetical protein
VSERITTAEHLGELVAGLASATGLRPETILALVTDLSELPNFSEVFQSTIRTVAEARGVEVHFGRIFQETGHTALRAERDGSLPGRRP